MDTCEKCNCQTSRFISLDEHIENGLTLWTSLTRLNVVECGELLSMTYTPEDARSCNGKKFGEATFTNLRIYLAIQKSVRPIKELSERLGISRAKCLFDKTQSARDSERQAIRSRR